MKKKVSMLLALTLMLSLCCTSFASAAEPKEPQVRANGYIVEFPDAKPFVDENSRTLIPVRFATESLGATVTWDNPTQTATISKNGVTVDVKIDSDTLTVTEKGTTKTVQMDTKAIVKDNRTYVPIRFVAESLGGFVDYSDAYGTVGIYQDVLTKEQITELRAYPYTQSKGAISYETAQKTWTQDDLDYNYGQYRDSFNGTNGYSNAKEYLYHDLARNSRYPFEALNIVLENSTKDKFYDCVAKEAVAELSYISDNIEFGFIADSSCIYQQDNVSSLTTTVRGIATVKCKIKPNKLTAEEMYLVSKHGFNYIPQGVYVTMPVDVHMNTQANYCVNVHTIVPLADQTPTDPTGGIQ